MSLLGGGSKNPEQGVGQTILNILELYFIIRMSLLFILPYYIYMEVRNQFLRTNYANSVRIVELNHDAAPVVPFADSDTHLYVELRNFRQAKEWLLEHGYQVRKFWVEKNTDHEMNTMAELKRTFLVKGIYKNGVYDYRNESVVKVAVEYGDGIYHDIFFEFPDREHPLDLNDFEEIDPEIELPSQMSQVVTSKRVVYKKDNSFVDVNGKPAYSPW